jgi:hypothetical protein
MSHSLLQENVNCLNPPEWNFQVSCNLTLWNFLDVNKNHIVRFEVLTAAEYEDDCLLGCCTMWFGRSLPMFQKCLLLPSSGLITLMMETASTFETLLNVYQTSWRNNPEDSHFQISYSLET